ncbi:MAG: hypothetical protein RIE78_12640, partial [Roseitalea porphyridii]|uniref:hypothetical protein n=1 Tax=Roseitalea porphyridii TaxID=1852022 RepID=UPI0032ECFD76
MWSVTRTRRSDAWSRLRQPSPFAELLDRLVLTPSRNAKLRLLVDYVAATPDPDRGYAIAAITRDLDI